MDKLINVYTVKTVDVVKILLTSILNSTKLITQANVSLVNVRSKITTSH